MSRPPNDGMGELSTIAKRNRPNPPKCRTSAAIPCGCRGAGLTTSASVSRSRTVIHRYDTTFSATGAVGTKQKAFRGREEEESNSLFTIQFRIALITCPCSSICRHLLLNPESRTSPPTTYDIPPTVCHPPSTTYRLLTTFLSNNIPGFNA